MTDEPLWPQARALRDALRQERARDPHWRVWSIEPVRLDDDASSRWCWWKIGRPAPST